MKQFRALLLVLLLSFSLLAVARAAELSDVPENAYYADAVRWAVEQDIITSYADGTFRPRAICTRGQMAGILWRAAGSPMPTLEKNPFDDISPAMSCYEAVLWAAEKGITTGKTAALFGPDDPCTCAQALTLLWRADGMPAAPADSAFADANAGVYYTDDVSCADHRGLLSGVEIAGFFPQAPVSRADIVGYLYMKSMPQMTEDIPLAGVGDLVISQQPVSMAPSGGMVSFTVQASGGMTPYRYRWETRTGSGAWTRVYDTTSNTLNKYPASSMIAAGLYFRCIVSDAAGDQVTSNDVKVLTAGENYTGSQTGGTPSGGAQTAGPLQIKTQPQNVTAAAGNAVTFKVEVAGGKAPYSYKWESRTAATAWIRVYDAASNTVTRYPTLDAMKSGLRFRCTITDAAGATVVSNEATLTALDDGLASGSGSSDQAGSAFAILDHPASVSCLPGQQVMLNVSAAGGPNPNSYIWECRTGASSVWSKFDGGKLKSTVFMPPTRAQLDAGLQVRVRAFDANGTERVSKIAYIRPLDTPQDGTLKIAAQPQPVTGSGYSPKDPVTFSVEVTGGTAPYSYQWQVTDAYLESEGRAGCMDISETPGGWATGYTSPQLTIPFNKDLISDNFRFCCVITDAAGNTVVSRAAGFADGYTGPYIVDQPVGNAYYPKWYDVVDDTTVLDLFVSATGGQGPYTYQWQYRPSGSAEIIDFGAAESSWARGYNTDTLTVAVRAPFGYTDGKMYQSPEFRCKVIGADGQYMFSNWCSNLVYDG